MSQRHYSCENIVGSPEKFNSGFNRLFTAPAVCGAVFFIINVMHSIFVDVNISLGFYLNGGMKCSAEENIVKDLSLTIYVALKRVFGSLVGEI